MATSDKSDDEQNNAFEQELMEMEIQECSVESCAGYKKKYVGMKNNAGELYECLLCDGHLHGVCRIEVGSDEWVILIIYCL